MTDTPQTPDSAPAAVDYRIFNLPGFGRVRAPVHMTEAQLIAALNEGEPDNQSIT